MSEESDIDVKKREWVWIKMSTGSRENNLLRLTLTLYCFGCTLSGIVFANTVFKVKTDYPQALFLSIAAALPACFFSEIWCMRISNREPRMGAAKKQVLSLAVLFAVCLLFSMDKFFSWVICAIYCGVFAWVSEGIAGCSNEMTQSRRIVVMPPLFFCSVLPTCVGIAFSTINTMVHPFHSLAVFFLPICYCFFWNATLSAGSRSVKRGNAFFVCVCLLFIVWSYSVVLFGRNSPFHQERVRSLVDLISFSFVYPTVITIPGLLEIAQIQWKRNDIGVTIENDVARYKNYCSHLRIVGGMSMISIIIVHVSWVLLEFSAYYLFIYAVGSCYAVIAFRAHYADIMNGENNPPYTGSLGYTVMWSLLPALSFVLVSENCLPPYFLPKDALQSSFTNVVTLLCGVLSLIGVWLRFKNLKEVLDFYSTIGVVGFHYIGLFITFVCLVALPFQFARKNAAIFLLFVESISILVGFIATSQKSNTTD